MSDEHETVATRLWRDRVQIREQERNDAQARARIAEEKVAILIAENDRLMAENARLRAQLNPDMNQARSETEQQMEALKGALMPLLVSAAWAELISTFRKRTAQMYRAALPMSDFNALGVQLDGCRSGRGRCPKAPGRKGQTVGEPFHGSDATDECLKG